jgi:hypothetical protein
MPGDAVRPRGFRHQGDHFPRPQVTKLHTRLEVGTDGDDGLGGVQSNRDFVPEHSGRQAVKPPAAGQLEQGDRTVAVGQGDVLAVAMEIDRTGSCFGEEPARGHTIQLP